jgi:hypothetical protein
MVESEARKVAETCREGVLVGVRATLSIPVCLLPGPAAPSVRAFFRVSQCDVLKSINASNANFMLKIDDLLWDEG